MFKAKIRSLIVALREKSDWRTLLFHSSWSLTLTSGLSYFFGLLRDRIFAHTFGLSRTLDIYNAAFVIPDMILGIMIGTALSGAFIPIFTKLYDENRDGAYRYARQFISWGVLSLAVIGVAIALFLPYFAHYLVPGFAADDLKQYILLTRLFLLSPILFCISNTYGKMLLSVKELFWYGISPALYNVGIILGALFLVRTFGVVGLVLGTLAGVVLHLGVRFWMVYKRKYGFRNRIDFLLSSEIKETIKLMAPKMLQYAMWHLTIMSFTGIASVLPQGSVAAYNYARNFQSVPVSLLGVAIAFATYPVLAHAAGKLDFAKFKHEFRRNVIRCLIYTTLAAIALAVFSKFLIATLLGGGQFGEKEVRFLASVLMVYCLSIPLESVMHLVHLSYHALKNTLIPAGVQTVVLIGTIIAAKMLAPTIGVYAIPLSFAGGLFVQIATLAIIFPFFFRFRMKAASAEAAPK